MKILEKSLNLNLANFEILHLLTIFFWRSFKALVGLRRRQLLREAARAFAEAAACGESGLTARHVDQSCPWVGLDWVTQNGPMDNSDVDLRPLFTRAARI